MARHAFEFTGRRYGDAFAHSFASATCKATVKTRSGRRSYFIALAKRL